ncbi:hypothetical protein C357_22655 [Citreicella sp. 357]|nr:hypothetical protein C357_22655 [Citreicella sp. 357]
MSVPSLFYPLAAAARWPRGTKKATGANGPDGLQCRSDRAMRPAIRS